MAFVHKQGADIFYEVEGELDARVVTLLNGHTRTTSDFKVMSRRLIEAGFRVIRIDNRDAGSSTTNGAYSLADMGDDVVSVWEALDVDSSHVLGISMGGAIAQIIASANPRVVEKLVLVSTAPSKSLIAVSDEPWPDSLPQIVAKLEAYFTPKFVNKNRLLIEAMAKNTLKSVQTGGFVEKAARQREAIGSFVGLDALNKIQSQTLIIHGDQDKIIDVQASALLEEKIPNSQRRIYEGIGHLLLAECPERLYSDVIEFLQG